MPNNKTIKRGQFWEKEKDLNFKARRGTGKTNQMAVNKGIEAKNQFGKREAPLIVRKPTRNTIKKPFAGVGTPINWSLWRVSLLKMANRIAENTETKMAEKDQKPIS